MALRTEQYKRQPMKNKYTKGRPQMIFSGTDQKPPPGLKGHKKYLTGAEQNCAINLGIKIDFLAILHAGHVW